MGNITNEMQDNLDVMTLKLLSEEYISYKRYLSHHLRNSLSALLGCAEMIERGLDDPARREEILNNIYRIKAEVRHMADDLERVAL